MGSINRAHRAAHVATLLLLIAAATGCATRPDPFDDWMGRDEAPLLIEQSVRRQEAAPEPLWEDPPDLASDQDPGPDIYVKIALERNPALQAAERRVAALVQRIPQVTSLDDPMLELAPIGEMAETAAGSVSVMTGISQRFPLGGKLDAAGGVARAEVAAAVADVVQKRLEVAADARRAYWSFYEAEQAISVIEESRGVLEQLSQTAESQYRAGRVSQQDVLRATVELSELDTDLSLRRQQAGTARAMLNRLMNLPVDKLRARPEAAEPDEVALELDALLESAFARNPALRQIAARIEAGRHRARLAQLQRIPDLNVSLSYNFVDDDGLSGVANGDDQWWIGFGINLPIWQARLDAAEREAKLEVLRGVSELSSERNAVAFRVQDSLLSVETSLERALLFRDVILPQARQTVEASLSGYRAGTVDFLTLASNWRRMLQFELMLHENIADLNRGLASLEQALGGHIPAADTGEGQSQRHLEGILSDQSRPVSEDSP